MEIVKAYRNERMPAAGFYPVEAEVGMSIVWTHIYRGGYGYSDDIPGFVVKIGASRLGIAIRKFNSDEWVWRWVKPEYVRLVEK